MLCVLWLARVFVLALDDYPNIEAAATATFEDARDEELMLHEVPNAATEDEIVAIHARVRQDLDADTADGRQSASLDVFSRTQVVDLNVHAQSYPWLETELAAIESRGRRGAWIDYALTWLAVWVVPVIVVGGIGWGFGRLRRRPR